MISGGTHAIHDPRHDDARDDAGDDRRRSNQLLHVTSTFTSFMARPAPRMLLAWPVRNIAQATADP